MAENRHPGISMHKLPVGGNFVGLLFAVGSALIFVLGFPTLWYFVALACAFGVGVAILLRLVGHHRSQHDKPLSILATSSEAERAASPVPGERQERKHTLPKLSWA
jgi:hypothetical protein